MKMVHSCSNYFDHPNVCIFFIKFFILIFPGKQDEWIEINPEYEKVHENTDCDTSFPKVRPSINVGCFPNQLLSPNCSGVMEILKVGQAVEAWKNDR